MIKALIKVIKKVITLGVTQAFISFFEPAHMCKRPPLGYKRMASTDRKGGAT
jgi:hypothetical protein